MNTKWLLQYSIFAALVFVLGLLMLYIPYVAWTVMAVGVFNVSYWSSQRLLEIVKRIFNKKEAAKEVSNGKEAETKEETVV